MQLPNSTFDAFTRNEISLHELRISLAILKSLPSHRQCVLGQLRATFNRRGARGMPFENLVPNDDKHSDRLGELTQLLKGARGGGHRGKGRIDRDELYRILRLAKYAADIAKAQSERRNSSIQWAQDWRTVLENAEYWLKRLRDQAVKVGWIHEYNKNDSAIITPHIDAILSSGYFKEAYPNPEDRRRSRRGRYAQPWIGYCHRRLPKAGITSRDDRILLMRLTGLLPY